MRFLYADDTPAPYDASTLIMLREAVSCAVALLESGELVARRTVAIDTRSRLAAQRFADIQDLGRRLINALGDRTGDDGELASLADRIRQAAADEVAGEVRSVRASLDGERERLDAEIAALRAEACEQFTDFLRAHDLPGARGRLELQLAGDGVYAARLKVDTEHGLGALFDLAVPERGPLAGAARVRDLSSTRRLPMNRIGRLRSTPRIAGCNVGRWFLVGAIHTGVRTVLRLREAPHLESAGVDLDYDGAMVEVRPMAAPGHQAPPPHLADGADAEPLRALERDVLELLLPLSDARVTVRRARIAGRPIAECAIDAIASHLIDAIAGTFRAIATRSGQSGSLVLLERVSSGSRKRLVLDIAELDERVDRLPSRLRRRFAALPLGEQSSGPTPPPAPGPRRATEVDRGW